jgi:hypothetical protein
MRCETPACVRKNSVILSVPNFVGWGTRKGIKEMRHVLLKLAMLIFALCLPIGVATAQTFGAITGEVRDQSGAITPNVPVTAINVATNVERSTATNESGVYSFPDLIPASYQVRVVAPGFQSMQSTVEIQVQQTARVDFTLTLGQSTQTIEVSAAAAALTTESATVGTVIAQKDINELPLNGRNFLQLVALAPNVTYGFAAPSIAASRQGGDRVNQNISVAGMRGTWNNYTLDGVSNLDPNFNLYIQLPSIDALQEFKVQSGIYPAEFGREATQINVSTKSGTNSLHGTAFDFLRNSDLDAKPYDFTNTRPAKNPFKQNQYGYYLGGPVYIPKLFNGRNRLFFMSNWEGFKSRLTNEDLYTVIPDAWRGGDFSQLKTVLLDPNTRTTDASGQLTASAFPNNTIPASRLDPTSQKLLLFLPHANINPQNSATPNSNLETPEETTVDKNQVTERIDFNQSTNIQWFGRFGWTSENTAAPILPQQGSTLTTNSKQSMVSNAWVLSPSKVNEFRFGYTTMFNAVADILSTKTNVVSDLGLPYPAEVPQSWGVPAVSMSNGLSSWGDNTSAPFVINDKITQMLDNFSWNRGKHSIRLGGEYRYDIYNQYGNQYTRGNPQFNGNFTANPQTLAGGNSAADFILGAPFRVDLALQLAQGNDTSNTVAAYVDDTWKVTPSVTVTLGLRWEMVQPWLDTQQNMTNFQFKGNLPRAANVDPSLYPVLVRAGTQGDFYQGLDYRYVNLTGTGAPGLVLVARDGRLGARMVNTDYTDFAPRIGIAWSPSSRWSIRTGFGIFYSQETANSKFDVNRGTAGRLTDLPDPRGKITLTYGNSFSTAILPVQLNPGLTWAIDQNIGTSYAMTYLFNVQRQFGNGTTLEVGYQGMQDRHLQNQQNADAGVPGIAAAQTRVPFPMYSSGIELTEGFGRGNYNGLSTKVTQRYKSGLTTLASFTWSKALDNGSAIRGTTGDQYPENPYCALQCEYGPSGFNTPLRLVTSVLYELPFGRGKPFLNRNGFVNAIAGGWQFTTIFTAQSGRPLNTVSWDAAGQVIQPNSNRLNSTGISPYAANPTKDQWFNPAAFQNLAPGQFGNIQRNSLRGPSTWAADFSVFKNIHFTERQTLQIRAEGFNIMNHPALGNPIVNWGGSSAIPAANFGLIRDVGSNLGTAYTMRQVQLAMKFIF